MGMFDWVLVEKEIYLPEYPQSGNRGGFQTKDFDSVLATIMITYKGKLVDKFAHTDLNFHGIFNFYTTYKSVWYEYNAKFTDGNLVSIERIHELIWED